MSWPPIHPADLVTAEKHDPSTLQALEEASSRCDHRLAATGGAGERVRAQPSQLARQLAGWKQKPQPPAQSDMPAGLGISLSRTTVRCSRSPSSCRSPATLEARAPPSRNGMLMSYKENQSQFTLNFYDTQGKAMGTSTNRPFRKGPT